MLTKRCWPGAIRLLGLLLGLIVFGCTLSSALAALTVVATVPVDNSPIFTTVDSTTNRIYVSNRYSNTVSVIDGVSNTVIATINVGTEPIGIAVNPNTNRLYVASRVNNNVTVIDTITNTVIGGPIPVGAEPWGIRVNLITNRIYIANFGTGANTVTVIDGNTNTVLINVPVGANPIALGVNSTTNRIYAANFGTNTISVIDGTTNTVIATIVVGNNPNSAEVNPITNRIYVTNFLGNTLKVIDGNTNTVLTMVGVGNNANAAGVNPNTNHIFVSNHFDNTVSVVDGATNTVIGSPIAVGNLPNGVQVNPVTNHIYVANESSNTVSVIADINPPTISKAFGAASIPISGTTSLSFTITNPNQFDALGGIAFTDNLPAGLVVATPPNVNNGCGGTLSAAGGSGTINLSGGTLAANANCSISLDVLGLTAGVKNNVTLPISSTLTGAGNPSNTATLTVVNPAIPTADIQLQKSVDNINPKVGDSVSFTVSVTNLGPDIASGVQVRDLLPGGLVYVSSVAPTGTTYLPVIGDWTIANLSNGQTSSLFITAKVTDDDPITNIATKTTENEYDPNLGNDSASVTLRPKDKDKDKDKKGKHHPADFSAQLRVTPDRLASIEPSNLISYTFTVKNIGEGRAGQTSLYFPLDPNLEIGYTSFVDLRVWVSAIITGGEHPHLEISLPSLEVNQVVSGTLVFRPSTNAKVGAVIFTRYFIHWGDDEQGGKQAGSNAVRFSLSDDGNNRDETGGAVQICLSGGEAVANQHAFKFEADFYAPTELVTLWYTDKNGVSVLLGTRQADEQGNLNLELVLDDLTAGDTYVVAGLGKRSEITGSMLITATG